MLASLLLRSCIGMLAFWKMDRLAPIESSWRSMDLCRAAPVADSDGLDVENPGVAARRCESRSRRCSSMSFLAFMSSPSPSSSVSIRGTLVRKS